MSTTDTTDDKGVPRPADADAYDPRIEEMPRGDRRRPRWLALVLVVLLAAGATLFTGYRYVTTAVDPSGEPGADVRVTIKKGQGTDDIATTLEKAKVIKRANVFGWWTKLYGKGPYLAGEYTLRERSSYDEVALVLSKGPEVSQQRLSIPEGLTIDQIAERVGKLPNRSADRFKKLATDGSVRSPLAPAGVTSLEGLLYPSTYFITTADDEGRILQRMVDQMVKVVRDADVQGIADERKLSVYQVLIAASLVEREAKLDDDRPLIAQVINNRLAKNMRLEIDATAIYALALQGKKPSGPKGTPTLDDLKVKSPYNTYLTPGLPPGPIANPGKKSLDAVLEPATGEFHFYVVIDKDGKHAFSTTLAEHNANRAKAKAAGL